MGGLLLLTLKNGAAAIVVTSATHRAFEKGKRSDAVVETASSAVSGNASFSPSAAADSCGATVATRSKSVTPSIGKTEPFSPDLAIAVKESGDGQTIVPHNAPRGEAAHSYDCS